MPFPRGLTVSLAGLLAAAVLAVPSAAVADSGSTLTVVGTSEVSDSGLIQNVIQPEFTAAYPQLSFKYVPVPTGAAIQDAENGTGGPSVLIANAASLESQFVADGYSANNQYGNAIFINDFVLAGPGGATDPAGVLGDAKNDIAQAFADVAKAGVAGRATFITLGGSTAAPGTTVEEHALWALVSQSKLTPSGVVLCTVSAADGGGMSPISPSVQPTSGQACPDSGTVLGSDAPSWYHVNAGASQGTNVIAANACTVAPSGSNTCYVLTDRGTYDYLSSGLDPAGTVPNLQIVSSGNSASAPGGPNALVNYFHAYVINPSKPNETVNLTAAQAFVSFLTSAQFQSQLCTYLNVVPYPNPLSACGAPFVADASPTVTATGMPASEPGGAPVTLTGTVTNNEVGYPAISGATVTVDEIEGGAPVPVGGAVTQTSPTGTYSITFTPPSSGAYQVATGQISQIEEPSLSPQYGDILSPGASSLMKTTVAGAATITRATGTAGGAVVNGTLAPATPDANATVTVLARPAGSHGLFKTVGGETLAAAQSGYIADASMTRGKWQIEVTYTDPGQFTSATSAIKTVMVPSSTAMAGKFRHRFRKGRLIITGSLSQPAGASGATVQLLGLRAVSRRFKALGRARVAAGTKSFTIKVKVKKHSTYVLQLKTTDKGQPASYSRLTTVTVK